jgi:hypothetical protein
LKEILFLVRSSLEKDGLGVQSTTRKYKAPSESKTGRVAVSLGAAVVIVGAVAAVVIAASRKRRK